MQMGTGFVVAVVVVGDVAENVAAVEVILVVRVTDRRH